MGATPIARRAGSQQRPAPRQRAVRPEPQARVPSRSQTRCGGPARQAAKGCYPRVSPACYLLFLTETMR
jgi:hypothetical protein